MRCNSKLYFVLVGFLMFNSAFGQVNPSQLWFDVKQEEVAIGGERRIIPNKFRLVKTNIEALKSILSNAPMEFTAEANTQAVIFELPTPDGRIQHYKLVESPIMEPGLAAKFLEIKTYAGQCIEDPADHVRLDITPKGFHAMVMSPERNYFIDPYTTETTEYYLSYFKKDFTAKKTFVCEQAQLPTEDYKLPDVPFKTEKDKNKGTPESIGDCQLRTYRLALAATGEYTVYHGGTVPLALAAQVTSMNRVNGVYETDFAVRMLLIANNNLIIYTNGATDPYSNGNGGAMLNENQTNLTAVIGSANYDIGHVFSTGGGGVAVLNSPCSASNKAKGVTGSGAPVGDPFDIDYVAHEMGHQFGGNHTFNGTVGSCNGNGNPSTAWEVGSGTTIMAYAGICGSQDVQPHSDPYFHGGNYNEMKNFIQGSGNACALQPPFTNSAPVITSFTASQTIPKSTTFVLTAAATDVNGNTITYCWEQMNPQASTQPPLSTSTVGPNFRSFNPTTSGSRYFPRLIDIINNVSPVWEVIPSVGRTLNFRVLARDNAVGGGCNDSKDIVLTVDGTSGPFTIISPSLTGISYTGNSTQTVTWNVNNTNNAPVSCASVDILLSTDGGFTYPTTLATAVPNSGSANVVMPNIATTTARIMVKGSGRAFFDISNNNFAITISSCQSPIVNAPSLTLPTCSTGGSIIVNATGTGTLEYSINNGASWFTSNIFNGLAPGTYNIIVRLQATPSCQTAYSGNPVIFNNPITLTNVNVSQPNCVTQGIITIIASGNAALEYSVNNGMSWQISNTFSGLIPGNYYVRIRLQSEPTCELIYNGNPIVLVPVNNISVNQVPNVAYCIGVSTSTIVFTGPVPGTVYNWTRTSESIGLTALSGSGTVPSFVTTNSGTTPLTSTFTVIPTYTSGGIPCSGPPMTFTITVNPTPTVNSIPNYNFCHNTLTTPIIFSSTIAGTGYNWTNNNTAIGLGASGTGNIGSFLAQNLTNNNLVATITVTPVFTNGGTTCTGTPKTFTITVSPAPKAVCKNATIFLNGVGVATLTIADIDGGSSSGTIGISKTTFNCSNIGQNIVTLTVTDACNQTSSCTAIVTVKDIIPPVINNIPGNFTIECGGEMPSIPPATATDNCSATLTFKETTTQSQWPNQCSYLSYDIIWTWTAVDPSGNKTVKSQIITIKDTKPPTFKSVPPPFITVECDEDNNNNQAPIPMDECDKNPTMVLDIDYNFNENGCPHDYTATYTWIAGDKCGNTSKYVQVITVVDNTPPVIFCPSNIIINSSVPVPVKWNAPKVSDNCDYNQISLVQIAGPPSGSTFQPGTTTTIIYKATDQCGNYSTCSFLVVITKGGGKEGTETIVNINLDNPVNSGTHNSNLPVNNRSEIILYQNEPNPFDNSTSIRFIMPSTEEVYINIYSVNGKLVKSINEVFEKGENRLTLSGDELLNTGVYYYQFYTKDFVGTRKMLFIK